MSRLLCDRDADLQADEPERIEDALADERRGSRAPVQRSMISASTQCADVG